MKYAAMVLTVATCSLGLNGMVPDVTKYQEICKNPEEKQKLMTVYKDFCQKRTLYSKILTGGSWCIVTPFMFKKVRNALHWHPLMYPVLFVGIAYAMGHSCLLNRNIHRNNLAMQEDLSYLNDDVLELLDNPKVKSEDSKFMTKVKVNSDTYSKNGFGYTRDTKYVTEILDVSHVEGIEKALSGKYTAPNSVRI